MTSKMDSRRGLLPHRPIDRPYSAPMGPDRTLRWTFAHRNGQAKLFIFLSRAKGEEQVSHGLPDFVPKYAKR